MLKTSIFILVLMFCHQAFTQTSEQEQSFLSKVRTAYQDKSAKKFLALYCWEGVDKFMRDQITEDAADEVTNVLETAELVPMEKDVLIGSYTVNGVTYGMNLTPLKTLKLTFKTGSSGVTGTQVQVGLKDGKVMIVGSAPLANGGKSTLVKTDDWENWAKLDIHSEQHGTLSTSMLESIARQFLDKKQIKVDNGEPIIHIIVCNTNRIADVIFHKAGHLVQNVEISSELKAVRTSEISIASEK